MNAHKSIYCTLTKIIINHLGESIVVERKKLARREKNGGSGWGDRKKKERNFLDTGS